MQKQVTTDTLAIADWVKGLAAIPERDFTLQNVQDYILFHAVRPETLDKYRFFSNGNYTRNLIFKNDVFECMAICWEIGQASRVHNHRDQNCWMAAPVGQLRVENFHVGFQDIEAGKCQLLASNTVELTTANPCAVDPGEPVHRVVNPREANQRAVTLHVYSRPFDTCVVYSPEQGTCGDIRLHYNTIFGKPVTQ